MRLKIRRPFGKREKLLVLLFLLEKAEKSTYQLWDAARYAFVSFVFCSDSTWDCESAAVTTTTTTITSEELYV